MRDGNGWRWMHPIFIFIFEREKEEGWVGGGFEVCRSRAYVYVFLMGAAKDGESNLLRVLGEFFCDG